MNTTVKLYSLSYSTDKLFNMKLIKLMTLALAGIVSLSACASTNNNESKEEKEMKAVVVYFSYSGNTEKAAKELGNEIDSPGL